MIELQECLECSIIVAGILVSVNFMNLSKAAGMISSQAKQVPTHEGMKGKSHHSWIKNDIAELKLIPEIVTDLHMLPNLLDIVEGCSVCYGVN